MKKGKFHYVIVGNSVAGIAALEAIRELDRERSITIIDRDPRHVYSRPLISYFLEGRVDGRGMMLRPRGYYRRMRADAMLGAAVRAIEPGKKRIVMAGGAAHGYGKLLLATGAAPVIPPVEGIEGPHVFTFTTWKDALAIQKDVGPGTRALVVGAGLIGVKAAEGLKALGAKVTIVECGDRPLPAVLDTDGGRLVAARIRREKVRLVLSRRVRRIVRKGRRIVAAELDDGESIPCDCVVAAVGVGPRTELCEGTGLKVRTGILVNRRMETSVKDIYAAGDVAEAGALGGGRRNLPLWTLACEQGAVAGTNMAGGRKLYKPGMQMNSIEVFGLPVITLGDSARGNDGLEVITVRAGRRPPYKKILLRDNRIVGALLIEAIERAGIIAGLMRDGVDVSAFKEEMLKESFGYIHVPEEYRSKHIAPMEV